jgi:hypothetical protein
MADRARKSRLWWKQTEAEAAGLIGCVLAERGISDGQPRRELMRKHGSMYEGKELTGIDGDDFDGLINVVRMSGKVAYLRTGCEERNGKLVGFCEAKRLDTGEEKRVEFSQDDAIRARLWDERPTVRKQVWENKERVWKDGLPNDAPWYRFPQRMLAWRAAGYCLRELFGDVLGGIRDEFEVREIAEAEEMRDITPPAAAENKPTPPKPPKPPAPPSAKTIEAEPEKSADSAEFVLGDFLTEIETALAGAKDEADVEEIWTDFDAPSVLETEGHEDMIEAAFAIKTRRLAQLSTLNGG